MSRVARDNSSNPDHLFSSALLPVCFLQTLLIIIELDSYYRIPISSPEQAGRELPEVLVFKVVKKTPQTSAGPKPCLPGPSGLASIPLLNSDLPKFALGPGPQQF